MLNEEKRNYEKDATFKQIYEKPRLTIKNAQNPQIKIESTLPTNKKPEFIQEEKPESQKKKQQDIQNKEDPIDKLLNIVYLKEIFSKNNPRFLENF